MQEINIFKVKYCNFCYYEQQEWNKALRPSCEKNAYSSGLMCTKFEKLVSFSTQ